MTEPAELPIGQPVEVRWGDTWYPGTVRQLAPNGALWCASPAFRGMKLMRSGEWRNTDRTTSGTTEKEATP